MGDLSSSVNFCRIKYFNTDYLKRTGVNKELGEQRVGLLPNYCRSGRVGASGFDYLSGEIAESLPELKTVGAAMCGHI